MNIIMQRLPYIFACFAAGVYFGPATDKLFFNPEGQAGLFAQLGFEQPETTVLLLGLFELAVIIALLLGIAGRFVAIAVIIEMIAAIGYVGVRPNNIAVLICAVGVLLLGTGAHSLWRPAEAWFARVLPHFATT
jgi:uncharacterized membrane protein YphA (DoxX/SURF4 family)